MTMLLSLLLLMVVSMKAFVFPSPSETSFGLNRPSRTVSFASLETEGSTTTSVHQQEEEEKEEKEEDWWKSVKLEHEYIAHQVRPDFEILQREVKEGLPLVYLDSAASSQMPKQVVQAMVEYQERMHSNVHRGAHTLSRMATEAYEDARTRLADFVGANSRNEIVFTKGATEAMNLVAQTYGRANIGQGDEIILTETEHHSNLVPWQILAQEKGCRLQFARLDPDTGALDLNHFYSLLNRNKTKMVAFQHVSNVLASVNPVTDMVKVIRAKAPHAKILVDACQSLPHQADLHTLIGKDDDDGVDFLAASGHKMCGPTGIGILWGREDVLNSMPPFLGGGEMIREVTLEGSTYAPAPGRFEAGTPPIAQAIGLAAAVRYLQSIGMDKIQAYEDELSSYLYKRLAECPGVTIFGPKIDDNQRAALCAFACEGVHPSDLSTFLDIEGVAVRAGHHCCQPLHKVLGHSHSTRASLYFYNTKEDIDKFIKALNSSLKFFRRISEKGTLAGGEEDDEDAFVPLF